jgi:hypothetical protein
MTRKCPFSMNNEVCTTKCIEGDCMAWREPRKVAGYSPGTPEIIPGYCKLIDLG